jgi:hypothetical protein
MVAVHLWSQDLVQVPQKADLAALNAFSHCAVEPDTPGPDTHSLFPVTQALLSFHPHTSNWLFRSAAVVMSTRGCQDTGGLRLIYLTSLFKTDLAKALLRADPAQYSTWPLHCAVQSSFSLGVKVHRKAGAQYEWL